MNNVPVKMELDSGTAVNFMSLKDLKNILLKNV